MPVNSFEQAIADYKSLAQFKVLATFDQTTKTKIMTTTTAKKNKQIKIYTLECNAALVRPMYTKEIRIEWDASRKENPSDPIAKEEATAEILLLAGPRASSRCTGVVVSSLDKCPMCSLCVCMGRGGESRLRDICAPPPAPPPPPLSTRLHGRRVVQNACALRRSIFPFFSDDQFFLAFCYSQLGTMPLYGMYSDAIIDNTSI